MSSYPPDPSWGPEHGDHDFGGGVSPEDRNWAMAAHLGSILTAWFALGLLAPLLVLVLKGGSSPYVRRHAVESLNFQINAFAYSIFFGLLFILLFVLLIGFVLLPAYLLFYLVCVILGTMRASAGEEFQYPLTLRLVS